MYSLTDAQKKTAKWLVESVKAGLLDEKFKHLVITALKSEPPKFMLTDREGTAYSPSDWIASGVSQDSLESLSRNGLLSYEETEPTPNQVWVCTLTDEIYTAVENNFQKKFGFA
jgi:hypothetical protein